jgi:ribosomal protein S18 acetylase RimI-like enzyme
MKIYIANKLSKELGARIDELLHLLDSTLPGVDGRRLESLLADRNFDLFIAEDDNGTIAGMLTLTRCSTLSRSKFWIEDVIVDPEFRGHGVGRSLVRAAVAHAEAKEERPAVYLTSNPSRVAARRIYKSEGFEEYETGVFRKSY